VEVQPLSEDKVVQGYEDGAGETHEEGLIGELTTLAVEAPYRVGEQEAAEGHEIGVDRGHRDTEGCHVGRYGIRVDREALTVGAQGRSCLGHSIKHSCQAC
jgi:hypothetical protein